jgi:hypothetical protein
LNVEEERAVLDRVEPSDEEKTEALETIERHVAADPEHPFGFDDDDVPGSDEG